MPSPSCSSEALAPKERVVEVDVEARSAGHGGGVRWHDRWPVRTRERRALGRLLEAGRADERPRPRGLRGRARRRCSRDAAAAAPQAARGAATGMGIDELYAHQVEAVHAAMEGDFIVTTGTASGKSMCFNLPTLHHLLQHADGARALPVPDEGAGAGPGARAARVRAAQADPPGDLRRRHAARGAAGDPPARRTSC